MRLGCPGFVRTLGAARFRSAAPDIARKGIPSAVGTGRWNRRDLSDRATACQPVAMRSAAARPV